MNILYDVHEIDNALGSGEKRLFVYPLLSSSMSRKKISESISHSCTLTPADVEAVLVSLGSLIRDQLSTGHRVHIPEIGYFAIKTCLKSQDSIDKIRGNDIRIRSINFKPENSLLEDIRKTVHFVRTKDTFRSKKYSEEEIISDVKEYLTKNRFINRRIMEIEFNLRQSMSLHWLSRLVELGVLVKSGAKNAPVYFAK